MEHLEARNATCDHIAETNMYTGNKGNMYLADTKMISLSTDCADMEIIAAVQVLVSNIHLPQMGVKNVNGWNSPA